MGEDRKEDRNTAESAENLETGAEPPVASPPGSELEAEVTRLREELAAAEQRARENYDRFVRQVAELENYKKRVSRDREEIVRFANEELIKDLLPVIDNLERAVAHAKGGGNGKPIVEGVELVLKELLDVLARHDAVQINALGQPFDPAHHDAMAQVETDRYAPNTVAEEHHKGYLFHGRLLRPALVSVAKSPEKTGDGEVEKAPSDD